jgi:phospholipid/cholesterol/gamma-HCH transport system permease protein
LSGYGLTERLREGARGMGERVFLLGDALRDGFRRPSEFKSVLAQLDEIGVKSLLIVVASSFFVGMVLAVQLAYSKANFAGRVMVGIGVSMAITKEFGPLLTALLVGGRVSAGITSVIGSMAVTEQVDAIKLLGATPSKKLVYPRLMATLIALPLLTAIADGMGILGGLAISLVDIKMSMANYMSQVQRSVELSDFFGGILKSVVFALFIAVIGCYNGLKVKGGSEGVGAATTRSVVQSSISIMIADFFMTKLLVIL